MMLSDELDKKYDNAVKQINHILADVRKCARKANQELDPVTFYHGLVIRQEKLGAQEEDSSVHDGPTTADAEVQVGRLAPAMLHAEAQTDSAQMAHEAVQATADCQDAGAQCQVVPGIQARAQTGTELQLGDAQHAAMQLCDHAQRSRTHSAQPNEDRSRTSEVRADASPSEHGHDEQGASSAVQQ